jgi:hypothetical protein
MFMSEAVNIWAMVMLSIMMLCLAMMITVMVVEKIHDWQDRKRNK